MNNHATLDALDAFIKAAETLSDHLIDTADTDKDDTVATSFRDKLINERIPECSGLALALREWLDQTSEARHAQPLPARRFVIPDDPRL